MPKIRLLHIIMLFFCAFPLTSFAESIPDDNSLDLVIQVYENATKVWEPLIHDLTLGLFWGLVTISFTWSSIQIALKDGGLVDVIADLTTRVLTVGVSVWLLNEAPNLARTLISSFQEVGTRLSGGVVKFSPSSVAEMGINIVHTTIKMFSVLDAGVGLMLFACGFVILICFALMALEMTTLIISAFITVSGGIVMMGFLGSEWTRENAMNYFTAVLGIAVKMFVMQLIFIIGYGFIHDWSTAITEKTQSSTILSLLVFVVVFYGLIREIPQMAASLASGRFTMAGGGMQAAVGAAAGMAAGAALAVTGVGAAAVTAASSSMSKEDTAANEASTLKRSLDTGSDAPASGSQSSGASGASDSKASEPTRTTGQRLMSATGAGLRAAGAASAKMAGNAAVSGLNSVAQKSAIGSALARAGVDLMKLDTKDPKQTQAAHEALMEQLNKDDGNNPNNYRDTTKK